LSSSGPTQSRGAESSVGAVNDLSEPYVYFDEVCDAMHAAAQAVGGFTDCFLQVANHTVRLRFAGPALVPHTLPALAHLVVEPTCLPDLTVYLCDGASTGTRMPRPTWSVADQTYRGEVPGCYNEGGFHASYRPWDLVLSLLDAESSRAAFWAADARRMHFSARGAPLRDVLHWWLSHNGGQLAHGAGVGTLGAGVLLTGRGSSGKSTTALACLGAGLFYAGDDHVAVSVEPTPFLHSLYNTAQLDIDGDYTVSDLVPGVKDPGPTTDRKVQLFMQQHCPDKIVSGFPLRAIIWPKVTGRKDTHLRAASGAEMLMALAPATVVALPGAGQEALRLMAELTRRVPGYVLELGTDLSQIPPLITGVISGVVSGLI